MSNDNSEVCLSASENKKKRTRVQRRTRGRQNDNAKEKRKVKVGKQFKGASSRDAYKGLVRRI